VHLVSFLVSRRARRKPRFSFRLTHTTKYAIPFFRDAHAFGERIIMKTKTNPVLPPITTRRAFTVLPAHTNTRICYTRARPSLLLLLLLLSLLIRVRESNLPVFPLPSHITFSLRFHTIFVWPRIVNIFRRVRISCYARTEDPVIVYSLSFPRFPSKGPTPHFFTHIRRLEQPRIQTWIALSVIVIYSNYDVDGSNSQLVNIISCVRTYLFRF